MYCEPEAGHKTQRDHTGQEQQHIYICILCLCIILCDTRKASESVTFIGKESLILSSVCVIIVTRRPISDSHKDMMSFKNKKCTYLAQFIFVCHSIEWLCLYCSANGWGFNLKLG